MHINYYCIIFNPNINGLYEVLLEIDSSTPMLMISMRSCRRFIS